MEETYLDPEIPDTYRGVIERITYDIPRARPDVDWRDLKQKVEELDGQERDPFAHLDTAENVDIGMEPETGTNAGPK